MRIEDQVLITGSTGMVGSALLRSMKKLGYSNLLTPTHSQLDLRNAAAVLEYFNTYKPKYVFHLAARVGGIGANMRDPSGFLMDNLESELAIFRAAEKFQVNKLLFLGSSCIYPRECAQPMKEEALLTGPLEPTNEGYALAKIAGLKMAEYLFRQKKLLSVCPMPCNIYGTGDSFDLEHCHVLSALVKRFYDAHVKADKSITLWGSGSARREFIHVDDVVRGMLFIFEKLDSPEIINLGTGVDVSIKELAELVSKTVGYQGSIQWDRSKPDGMPRKCLDVSRLKNLGFQASISLEEGILKTVHEYQSQLSSSSMTVEASAGG